jgi:uncharacterized membrane protein
MVSNTPENTPDEQLGLERLIFFSDAVFAIAITLLALDIHLPAGQDLFSDTGLLKALAGIWQKYLAYIISFLVIGSFWMAHHRKFRLIVRYDSRLIALNLLLLMVVAFVPFPSSVISEFSNRTATVYYSLTVILAALLLTFMWAYASKHDRLVLPNLDIHLRRRQFIAPLLTAAVFLISIGIAWFNSDAAKLFWLLILPVSIYANR